MSGATLQERLAAAWGVTAGRWALPDGPARRCLGLVNRRGAVEWWTAARIVREAGCRAAWLRSGGLGPGQVAVLVTADPRFACVGLLAILQLGAVPLLVAPPTIQGLNSDLGRVLAHVVGLSRARVVWVPPGMDSLAARLGEHTSVLVGDGGPAHAGQTVEVTHPSPDAIAALQLTSGTTGLPRICAWRHRQVLAAIDGMGRGMALRPDDRFVNWTPLYHDMGLVNNTLLCQVLGLELVLMDPFHFVGNPALWLRTLHHVEATQTWSPNFGYALATERIPEAELEGVRLERMRGFWNAGEKVHHRTFVEFFERFRDHGVRWGSLKANFGCAENVGGATFTDPEGELVVERVDAGALHRDRMARVVADDFEGPTETLVSTGKGHPTLQVHVLGDHDEVLQDGRVGRIALDSPSRMDGFLGQPEHTREVLRGDLVLTGDLGYLRAGELYWVGRDREQINLAGVKHDPSDFEAALGDIPALRKGCFAAFGVEDAQRGTERLVVVCEVREALESDGLALCESIRSAIAVRVGVAVSQVALAARGQLTKTSSGKRRHLHFRDAFLAGSLELLALHPA